jgi:large subunit ribosomal protein L21
MYAIVEIAGQQYKVQKDQQIYVHRLEGKEGSKVSFDNVLLTADGDKIEVGAPAVKGISVSAKILEHLKGDKVIVFKKKRRKGYKVKNGHRQYLSKIEIESIGASTGSATSKSEKATKSTTSVKTEEKKEAPKAEAKPKAATAKSEPKKAEAKTSSAKADTKDAPKAKKTTKAVDKEPAKGTKGAAGKREATKSEKKDNKDNK